MGVVIEPEFGRTIKLKTEMTEGEKEIVLRIVKLFQNTNRNIELYIQPNINGLRPDIICIEKKSYNNPGGIWIIEVKDWNLDNYEIKGDKWFYKGIHQKLSPIKQVNSYRNEIIGVSNELQFEILKNQRSPSQYLVKKAVYFHTNTRINIHEQYTTILFKSFFDSELKEFFCSSKYNKLNENIYENVKQYLGIIESDVERDFFSLNAKQAQILSDFRMGQKRKKIIGPAGSGKTELLAQMIANELMDGKNVLVLTFNITLRRFIHDRVRNSLTKKIEEKNLTILNYHSFIKNQMEEFNIKNNEGLKNFDNINLFDSVKTKKYTSIFIDEFQDYKSNWVTIIEKYFVSQEGSFVVVGDANQNIYNRELSDKKLPRVSIKGRPTELNESQRSVSRITEFAKNFQKEFLFNKYDVPEIEMKQLNIFNDVDTKIWFITNIKLETFFEKLNEFLKLKSIKPNNVSIVSFTRKKLRDYIESYNDCCNRQDGMSARGISDNSRTVSTNAEFRELEENEQNVKKYERTLKSNFKPNYGTTKAITVNSLKGSETDVEVIMLDDLETYCSSKNENFDELLYTAITRAKKYLFFYYDCNNESSIIDEKVLNLIKFLKSNKK